MYPRNAASPERIAVGPVVQISDGAVQTSGVTVSVTGQGGAETGSGGTVAYSTGGIVFYTPTQAETNYTSFIVTAYKTGCIPASITIVTTASVTPGYAGVDWSKVTNPTTTVGLTGTTIATTQKVDVETIKTNAVVNGGTVTFPTNATLASTTNITAGIITTVTTVTNQLTAAQIATGVWQDTTAGDFTVSSSIGKSLYTTGNAPGAASGLAIVGSNMGLAATATSAQLVDDVWDEIITAGIHNTGNSAGRRLRTASGGQMDSGTAQAGGADTITLATSASTTAGLYVGCAIVIDGGTGAGQARYIIGYTAARVATVARPWTTAPDGTSTYVLYADNQVDFLRIDLAQAGGVTSITLDANASATNDIFNGKTIRILAGTGKYQVRIITDYDGTTKVATVDRAWQTNPDSTSYYGITMYGEAFVASNNDKTGYSLSVTPPTAAAIADAVWDEESTGHIDAGKAGAQLWTDIDAIAVDVAGLDGAAMVAAAPSAATIADAVWDEASTGHTDAGKAGAQLWTDIDAIVVDVAGLDGAAMVSSAPTAAAIADAVWDEDATAHQMQGTFGQAIGDPGADPTTIWGEINGGVTVATNNDKTGYTASTVSDKTGYSLSVAPPTSADIVTAMEANGSKLDHLWEMTEDDGGIRRLTTNSLEQAPTGSAPSAATIASAVWQDTTAGDFTVANSVGKSLMNGVALGTGLTVNDITTKTGFTASVSGTVDANVTKVKGTTITGSGTAVDPWGP